MKMRHIIIFIFLLYGCDNEMNQSTIPQTIENTSESNDYIPINVPDEKKIKIKENLKINTNGSMLLNEYFPKITEINLLFKEINETNYSEYDFKLKTFLNKNKDSFFNYYFEQLVSNKYLKVLNSVKSVDKSHQEMVSYYTKLLLRNNHQDATIIYNSLKILNNYWSKDEIRNAANLTILNSESWISKSLPCTDCKGNTLQKESNDFLKETNSKEVKKANEVKSSIKNLKDML